MNCCEDNCKCRAKYPVAGKMYCVKHRNVAVKRQFVTVTIPDNIIGEVPKKRGRPRKTKQLDMIANG